MFRLSLGADPEATIQVQVASQGGIWNMDTGKRKALITKGLLSMGVWSLIPQEPLGNGVKYISN